MDALHVLGLDLVPGDVGMLVAAHGDVAHEVLDEDGMVVGPLGNEFFVGALEERVDFAAAVGLTNYQVGAALLSDAVCGVSVKTIFVTGAAGGVGSALVDLGKAMGLTVIGSVSSKDIPWQRNQTGLAHQQCWNHVCFRRQD